MTVAGNLAILHMAHFAGLVRRCGPPEMEGADAVVIVLSECPQALTEDRDPSSIEAVVDQRRREHMSMEAIMATARDLPMPHKGTGGGYVTGGR
ncbi:hypothetical protein FHS96_005882 [Sphingomonas zeicaulis]|uniref:hypothetical protein n=1 Tax=Sphingomonas zeicaulis TaxID=1632740 RepID=UPI003D1B0C0A